MMNERQAIDALKRGEFCDLPVVAHRGGGTAFELSRDGEAARVLLPCGDGCPVPFVDYWRLADLKESNHAK